MSKSTRGKGFGRRSGTVTVIEQQVHRSAAQNARLAFVLTAIVVGLSALVVASEYMHPILALFLALLTSAIVGALAWVLVRIWPVLRVIWWWTPEIVATVMLTWGWVALAASTPAWATLLILAVVVGGCAAWPFTRRWVVSLAWCVIVRHRLRVCFSQFIIANRSGSLPLILWARPTPAGERVWVWLRPGLSLKSLTEQLERIAVACIALENGVTVDKAGKSAAYVRFDIKRREVLTSRIGSPLVDHLDPEWPLPDKEPATVTRGLDLDDLDDDLPEPSTKTKPATTNGRKPAAPVDDADDDVNQWI